MPTEIWKQIKIREFRGEYKISESGRIKKNGRYLKTTGKWIPEKFVPSFPQSKKKPYLRIKLHKDGFSKGFYIHRLVALMFIPNPENKPCVNHKDGDKLNNHYTNLEWCTDAENNRHASLMGLFIGSNGYLTKEERIFIWDNFVSMGRTALAKKFNKSEDYIVGVFIDRGRNREKISLKKVGAAKKSPIRHKEIINIETGQTYISEQLAKELKTNRKEVLRMISEERKPNTSPYRYTGKYIIAPLINL